MQHPIYLSIHPTEPSTGLVRNSEHAASHHHEPSGGANLRHETRLLREFEVSKVMKSRETNAIKLQFGGLLQPSTTYFLVIGDGLCHRVYQISEISTENNVDLSKRWFEQYSDQQILVRFNKTWKLTRLTQILIEPHKTDLGRKAFLCMFQSSPCICWILYSKYIIVYLSEFVLYRFIPVKSFWFWTSLNLRMESYPGRTHSGPLSSSRSHASMPAGWCCDDSGWARLWNKIFIYIYI